MNESLMRGCKMLNDYSIYVAKEREFYGECKSHERAVKQAIDYCIENDILKDFLLKERKAVYMYSLSEYNQTAHLKAVKEESFEDGKEQGIAIGEERGIAQGAKSERINTIIAMKRAGKSPEEIAAIFNYSLEEVNEVFSKST